MFWFTTSQTRDKSIEYRQEGRDVVSDRSKDSKNDPITKGQVLEVRRLK